VRQPEGAIGGAAFSRAAVAPAGRGHGRGGADGARVLHERRQRIGGSCADADATPMNSCEAVAPARAAATGEAARTERELDRRRIPKPAQLLRLEAVVHVHMRQGRVCPMPVSERGDRAKCDAGDKDRDLVVAFGLQADAIVARCAHGTPASAA